MKSFTQYISELYQNDLKKGFRTHNSMLGHKPEGAKHIGTLESGDHVYHRANKGETGTTHHYFVTGQKSGKTNVHLTTWQNKGEKSEDVGMLTANKSSKGAHHLYQHLVVHHNKIITSSDQSEGARKVWEKAAKHKKVNVHGYDPLSGKAVHAHPSEDDHYVHPGEIHKHSLDSMQATSEKDKKKHMDDIADKERTTHLHMVMHRK